MTGLVAVLTLQSPRVAGAADLTPRAAAAFEQYVELTESRMENDAAAGRFLWLDTIPAGDRAVRAAELRRGAVIVRALETRDRGRPIDMPGGLVHHWVGLAFVPGVPLPRVLALLQDYDHHAAIYAPRIAQSRLRSRQGDTFTFHLRFVETRVITAVIDSENQAAFSQPSADRVLGRIVSTRLAEIDDAGTAGEREKRVGHDSGYLWRLNTYWRLLERDGGTYVQCESVSLTRGIPAGLGWLIGPFVTSVPRESLEFTLETTRRALAHP